MSDSYVEIIYRANVSQWSDAYVEEDIIRNRYPGESHWGADEGYPDPSEKGEHGYTREQCEDIGIPFKPVKFKEDQIITGGWDFKWRWTRYTLDLSQVHSCADMPGNYYRVYIKNGGCFHCKGSYEAFRDTFFSYLDDLKIKQKLSEYGRLLGQISNGGRPSGGSDSGGEELRKVETPKGGGGGSGKPGSPSASTVSG